MFELIASGAYAAIETVFNTTQSPTLRRRSLDGFQQYATVASYYGKWSVQRECSGGVQVAVHKY